MKKKLLWIAAALIVFGGVLFAVVLQATGWDFFELLQPQTTKIEITQPFSAVEILAGTEDIVLAKSEDGTCKVVFTERRAGEHTATVTDGTLRIQKQKKSPFSLFSLFSAQETVLYLPQAQYGALKIEADTGSVLLPRDFTFETIDVQTDTGSITCEASASDAATLKTDTGDLFAENLSAQMVVVMTSTGRTELRAIRCGALLSQGDTGELLMDGVTAREKITLSRDTGDVTLNGCDAAELEIRTDTGDVRGTLLTEKIFICRTDTGRIDVPETLTGGKCKITTDTGDISVQIAK